MGTNIGLLLDICSNSFWVLIGPFFGSFNRRLIYDFKDHNQAMKAAAGSL
jgi:uncharacterized protein YqgC (DUF456 family)